MTKINLALIRKNSQELLKVLENPYREVFRAIVQDDVIKATKFISPNLIVRAVKRTFKAYKKKPRAQGNIEITLTVGNPNYLERDLIKIFQEAKEPFPIKKVQLKLFKKK